MCTYDDTGKSHCEGDSGGALFRVDQENEGRYDNHSEHTEKILMLKGTLLWLSLVLDRASRKSVETDQVALPGSPRNCFTGSRQLQASQQTEVRVHKRPPGSHHILLLLSLYPSL